MLNDFIIFFCHFTMKVRSAFILSNKNDSPPPPPQFSFCPTFYEKKKISPVSPVSRKILTTSSFLLSSHHPNPMPEYNFTLSYSSKEKQDWFKWKPTSLNKVVILNNRFQA
jgi:hypothetical protein